MSEGDWIFFVIVGAVFTVLGIVALIWGRIEEKRIFSALAEKHDLREFTQDHIESPQPGALKIGGWLGLLIGVILIVAGIVIMFVL